MKYPNKRNYVFYKTDIAAHSQSYIDDLNIYIDYLETQLYQIKKGRIKMIKYPKECCKPGTYKCQIPIPIDGRRQDIDICIADLITALNASNIITVASCCGHGKQDGIISLKDGRELIIKHTRRLSVHS